MTKSFPSVKSPVSFTDAFPALLPCHKLQARATTVLTAVYERIGFSLKKHQLVGEVSGQPRWVLTFGHKETRTEVTVEVGLQKAPVWRRLFTKQYAMRVSVGPASITGTSFSLTYLGAALVDAVLKALEKHQSNSALISAAQRYTPHTLQVNNRAQRRASERALKKAKITKKNLAVKKASGTTPARAPN